MIKVSLVEMLTGISLKKAIELAEEAPDTTVVDHLKEKFLFRYYRVTGAQLSGNFSSCTGYLYLSRL